MGQKQTHRFLINSPPTISINTRPLPTTKQYRKTQEIGRKGKVAGLVLHVFIY